MGYFAVGCGKDVPTLPVGFEKSRLILVDSPVTKAFSGRIQTDPPYTSLSIAD